MCAGTYWDDSSCKYDVGNNSEHIYTSPYCRCFLPPSLTANIIDDASSNATTNKRSSPFNSALSCRQQSFHNMFVCQAATTLTKAKTKYRRTFSSKKKHVQLEAYFSTVKHWRHRPHEHDTIVRFAHTCIHSTTRRSCTDKLACRYTKRF